MLLQLRFFQEFYKDLSKTFLGIFLVIHVGNSIEIFLGILAGIALGMLQKVPVELN